METIISTRHFSIEIDDEPFRLVFSDPHECMELASFDLEQTRNLIVEIAGFVNKEIQVMSRE